MLFIIFKTNSKIQLMFGEQNNRIILTSQQDMLLMLYQILKDLERYILWAFDVSIVNKVTTPIR